MENGAKAARDLRLHKGHKRNAVTDKITDCRDRSQDVDNVEVSPTAD
jgi:hypothetical protein